MFGYLQTIICKIHKYAHGIKGIFVDLVLPQEVRDLMLFNWVHQDHSMALVELLIDMLLL